MAHFVYNSGGFRGGAWEARAPLLFLDQTEAEKTFLETGPPLSQGLDERVPPPLSEGLDLPLYNNIATTHLCLLVPPKPLFVL